jgi:osmotically-inducible protein OsmY
MYREKTSGRTILVAFVMAGGLVLAMFPPVQADQTMTGQTIAPDDPHYLDNKADLRLKLDVKREIALSPYVDGDFIHVTVRNGEVTLRGSVEDQRAAEAAIKNARDAGAKKVINKLNIEDK